MKDPFDDSIQGKAEENPDSGARLRQHRGTRQLLIARSWFFITGYVVTIILARGLGPAEFGVYGVIMSVLVWLEMLSGAGVPAATGRLIPFSAGQERQVEGSARFILLTLGMGLFVVCWLAAPFIVRPFEIPNGTWLFRLAIVDIPLMSLYLADQGILNGHRRFGVLAATQIAYGTAKLAGISLLLLLGLSVPRVLIVNILATCAPLAFLMLRGLSPGIRPDRQLAKQLVRLAVPMGTYLVALQVLVNLPLWALKGLWEGEGEVIGHFVAAMQISRTLTIIPAVQSGVVFVSVGWALARDDLVTARNHLEEASRFALILIAPACVILGSEAMPVLSLLFSEQYAGGAAFLWLQLIGFGAYALADIFANSLMAAGRQRIVARTSISLVPVVILVTFVLLQEAGPVGAAASFALIMVTAATVVGVMTLRHFHALVPLKTLARVGLAVALVGLASRYLETTGGWLLLELLALGALYLLVLRLLGEISLADFKIPRVGGPGAASEPGID